jgi:hypothetical protein
MHGYLPKGTGLTEKKKRYTVSIKRGNKDLLLG